MITMVLEVLPTWFLARWKIPMVSNGNIMTGLLQQGDPPTSWLPRIRIFLGSGWQWTVFDTIACFSLLGSSRASLLYGSLSLWIPQMPHLTSFVANFGISLRATVGSSSTHNIESHSATFKFKNKSQDSWSAGQNWNRDGNGHEGNWWC
jgi:hypothetical protein